ncbi:IPT/TIG domain-containing protein [Dictyostelium discoideum AX4]|uniref:IPT/TIG domain-containing protein n=1 Tax=Dictyostelium discoideum TaxID=44689 RepID=C7FZX2_DICDI|nr:IPT/TIG domain-containing protein [Dictyostelium discoideum AX4]EEU04144.1 IPT/TIG domain-containing protein [Dictyostelium discoideum AX4]|eukprot:XP_002649194.1 IPT/TIG domain-containing protein [Dictyostelium discoideum AX4]
MVKYKIIISFLFFILYCNCFTFGSYTFDTKNWSTNGTLSSCVFYDFVNNDYYDLRAIVHNDHQGPYKASFPAELPGGIQTPYTMYFNPCFNDNVCPGGLSVGCMSYVQNSQKILNSVGSLSEPHSITLNSEGISIEYQSALLPSTTCASNGNRRTLVLFITCIPTETFKIIGTYNRRVLCEHTIYISSKLVCKDRGILFNQGLFYDLTPMKLLASTSHQITNSDQTQDILFNLFGNVNRCGTFGTSTLSYQSCILTVANKVIDYKLDSRYATSPKSVMVGSLSQPRTITFTNDVITIIYSSTTGFTECSSNGNKYSSKYILICDPFTEYYVDKFTLESQCIYQIKVYTKYACPTLRLFKQTQYYDLSPLMLDSTRNYTTSHITDGYEYNIVFNIGNKAQMCSDAFNDYYFACQYDPRYKSFNPLAKASLGQRVTFDLNQVKFEYTSPMSGCLRTFIIVLTCDENQHYQLVSTLESPACVYTVTIETKYVCESTIYYNRFDYTYYDITPIKTEKDSPNKIDIVVGGYPYRLFYGIGNTVDYCGEQVGSVPGVDYQACQYLSGLVIQVGSLKNTSMILNKDGISIYHTSPFDLTKVCQNTRYQRVNILNMVCDPTATNVVVSATETANNWACEYTIEIKTKYACSINYAPVLPVVGNPCLYSCTPPGALNPKAIVSVLLNLGVCFSEINKYGTGAQSLLNIFKDTWVSNHNGYDDWMGGQLYSLLLTGKPQSTISPYVISITHDNLCTYGADGLSKAKNSINDFLTITNDLLEISNRAVSLTVTKYTYSDGAITLSTHKLLSTSTGGLAIIKYKNLLCYYSIVPNLQTLIIGSYLLSCPYYSLPTITVHSLTPSIGKVGDTITINGQNLDTDIYDVYFNIIDDNSKIKATITSRTVNFVKVIVPNGFGNALVYTQNILNPTTSDKLSFSYPSPTIVKVISQPFSTGIINRFFVIGQNHRSLITNIVINPYIDNIEKEAIYCEIEKYCPSSSKIPSISGSAVGHPCIDSTVYSENSQFFDYSKYDVFVCIKSSLGVGSGIIKFPSQTFTFAYSYKAPLLYFVPPGIRIPTDGGSFQLDGKNFPPTQEIIDLGLNTPVIIWNNDNFVTFKGTNLANTNINWKSSKSILCVAPPGFGGPFIVTVTVGKQVSKTIYPSDLDENPTNYNLYYYPPAVVDISEVSTDGGEVIIKGTNFIPASLKDQINNQPIIGSPHSVEFNNVLSSSWTWIDSTHVKAIVQKGIGTISTIVNVGGQRSDLNPIPVNFYKRPELDNKKYENFANSDILITGSNFIPVGVSAGSSSSVKIGGIPCNSVTWVDSKSVICNVPIGTGDNLNIQVTVGGQQTELNDYFSYLGQCDFLCSDLSNLELAKVIGENKKDLKSTLLLTGVCLEQIEQYNFTDINDEIESSWIENSIIDDWTSGKFYNYFKSSESYSTVKTLAKYITPKNPCIYENKRVKNSLDYLFEINSDIFHLIELSISSKISYPDSPYETYFYESSSNPEYGLSIITFDSAICSFTESTIQDYQSGKVLQSCSIIPIINQVINPTTTLQAPYQYSLTIIGRLFDSSTRIFLSGYECPIIGNIATNQNDYIQTLSCSVPPEIESYSASQITFYNDYSENNIYNFLFYFKKSFFFKYPISTVTQIQYPSSGPIQMNSEIKVIGFNFFPYGITNPSIQVFIDDLELTDTIFGLTSINGVDSFSFIASGLGSLNLPMFINDDINLEFSFERPIINSILPTNGDYNTKVTINGNNFRKGQSVKIGDILVNDIEFISNQEIIASAPFGFISGLVVVYSDDQFSLEEISFSYTSPIIDQVILSNYESKLNTTGTNYFTVIGRGLGTYIAEQVDIIINQEFYASCEFDFCESLEIIEDIDIKDQGICQYLKYNKYQYINENFDILNCILTDSIGKDKSISIKISEFQNQTFTYSYYEPWIEKLTQNSSSANTDGGEVIVINGYNFLPFENLSPYYENNETIAQWLNQSEILIGESYLCQSINWTNSYELNCTIPPGIGVNHTIIVKVGLQSSNHTDYLYSYDSPNLDTINNSTGNETHYYSSTDGNNEIIITGYNFIPKELSDHYNQNENKTINSILLGKQYCNETIWINSTTVKCKPIAGIGSNYKIIIKVGNQDSNETVYFSYEKPILDLKNYTGSTNGNTEITITGINFIPKELADNNNFNQSENYIMIGDNKCNETIWINSTTVKCKPISGTGINHRVIITVGNQNSNETVYFSYDKPILDIKNYSSPTDGNTEITITGENFIPKELAENNNFNQSENYIMIGNNECNETIWINSTTVKCKPLAGIGSNYKIFIKVGNQDSNETVYFSYEMPILDLKNYTGSTNGNTEITITGINFIPKELADNNNFNQSENYIMIGDNKCNETTWINSTTVKCKPISGTGINHKVIITVGNQNSNETVYFSYDKPILDIKNYSSPTDGNTEITITGENFIENYNQEKHNENDNFVRIGENKCNETKWINSTTIKCKIIQGIGLDYKIVVTVANQQSNENVFFSYEKPMIDSKTLLASTSGSETIKITGTNFIPSTLVEHYNKEENKDNSINSVTINNEFCNDITWISSTELTCKPLAGVGTNHTIFILVGTQKSNEENSFSYKPPNIEEFKYYTAPTHSNKIITITGENFIPIELLSKDNSNSSVLIDNIKCEEIKWIDSTKVSCQVPVGQGKDLSIKVKIENQETEENQQFSYDKPFIQSINPNKGRCNQEVLITIQGDSFGKSDQLIKIGNNECQDIQFYPNHTFTCKVPIVENSIESIVLLNVGNQDSNDNITYKYYGPPEIKSIGLPSYLSFKGDDLITIIGNNFIEYDDGSDEIVKFNNEPTTIIENTETYIKIKTLSGDEFNVPIAVELNGQISNTDTSFVYSNPIIESVTPSSSSSKSNTNIIIKGHNLGYLTNTPKITIGSSNCLNIKTISPNEIHCIVMKSSAGTKQLTLTYESYQPTYSQFTHKNDDDSDSHDDDDDDHKNNNGPKNTILSILGGIIGAAASAAVSGFITSIFGGATSVATAAATATAAGTAVAAATTASTATAIAGAITEGVAVAFTGVSVIAATAGGVVITSIVTATAILISGGSTQSPTPTIAPTISPTPTPTDNYWVRCMVDYSRLTLQVDNLYGQDIVCIDGNGISSIFNESFSCKPDLINDGMICAQQHQDGTNSTTTFGNSTLICHIDSTKSCEISPPFIIPSDPIEDDEYSNILECQYNLIENSLSTHSNNSPLRCYNNETENYFIMNTTLSCSKDESLSQDKDTISCLADTDDTQIFFYKNSITCITDYPYYRCTMKSQPSQDDNIIPKPTLPPIPSIDDDSTCIYDSANSYSIDLQLTTGTNAKCPKNEKELRYDLSTSLTCTDYITLKNSTYSISYSNYICIKTK